MSQSDEDPSINPMLAEMAYEETPSNINMFDEPKMNYVLPVNIRDDDDMDQKENEAPGMDDESKTNQMKNDEEAAQFEELPLEDVLENVASKLREQSNIDSKVSGFKTILSKIQETKLRLDYIDPLCEWLVKNGIIERFLHDDSHTQILRNMSLILKFLYDHGKIEILWIHKFMQRGLTGLEEFLKVVQNFINFLKIEDLTEVFRELSEDENIENQNLVQIIYSIVNCKLLSETNLPVKKMKESERFAPF